MSDRPIRRPSTPGFQAIRPVHKESCELEATDYAHARCTCGAESQTNPFPPASIPVLPEGVEIHDGKKVLSLTLAQRADLRAALIAFDRVIEDTARAHEVRARMLRDGTAVHVPHANLQDPLITTNGIAFPLLEALRDLVR